MKIRAHIQAQWLALAYSISMKQNKTMKLPTNTTNHPFSHAILLLASMAIPAYLAGADNFNNQFWCDELTSLHKFILVPTIEGMTNYSTTNNHILFNVICNITTKILSIEKLDQAINSIWALRIVSYFFSISAIIATYIFCNRFLNKSIAFLSSTLFATSPVFYNFSLQIRGYSLSMLFSILVVYSIFSYNESKKTSTAVLGIIICGLFIYIVPSNCYVLVPAILFFFLASIVAKTGLATPGRLFSFTYTPACRIFCILAAGLLFGALLYLPVLSVMRGAENIVFKSSFDLSAFTFFFNDVYLKLIYGGYFITPVVLISLYTVIKDKSVDLLQFIFIFLSFLLIAPPILLFASGHLRLDRVFSNLLPIVSIHSAIAIYLFITRFLKIAKPGVAIFFMCIYSMFGFLIFHQHYEERILGDIRSNVFEHNLTYNYFLRFFQPIKVFSSIKQSPEFASNVYIHGNSQMTWYFEAHGVRAMPFDVRTFEFRNGTAFITTTTYQGLVGDITAAYPEATCEKLIDDMNFDIPVRCRCEAIPCNRRFAVSQ
jgi:hypothetical protein